MGSITDDGVRQGTLCREILEAAESAIWVTDARDRIVFANPSMQRILGVTGSELLGLDVTSCDAPAGLRQIVRFYEQARDSLKPATIEAALVLTNGQTALKTLRLAPRQGGEAFAGMVCSIQDGPGEASTFGASSEAEIHRILRSTDDAVIAVDLAGRVTHANSPAERLTGWSKTEAIGRSIDEVFRLGHDDSEGHAESPSRRVLAEGLPLEISNQTQLHTRDKRKVLIGGTAAPVRNFDGEIIAAILRFRDQAEERLGQRLMRMRLDLIEYASHHTLDEVLQRALDEVGAFVDSPIGFYHIVGADQKTLKLQQWSTRTLKEFCRAAAKGKHYDIDQAGVWVDCVRLRRPVVHNDYASLPHKSGMPDGHAAVVRELVVPVLREGKPVAILGVGNKPTDYVKEDVETVAYLADVVWEIARNKQTEDSVRDSEARLRSMFDQTFQLAGLVSLSGILMAANQTALDFVGAESVDVVGRPFWETPWWTHSEEQQAWIREAVAQAARGEVVRGEVTHVSKEGDLHVFDFSLKPILDSRGDVLHLMPESRDITELKRSEDALKALNTRLSLAVRAADLGVWEYDLRHRRLFFDEKMLRLYGLSEDEFDGTAQTWIDLVHPEDRQATREIAQKAILDIEGSEAEFRIVLRSGEIRHTKAFALSVQDPQGNPVGAIGVNYDITEHKAAEQALRQRETLLQKVFDILPIGLWFADRDGHLLRGNEAGIRIWGAEPLVSPSEYGVFRARRLPSRQELAADDWALAHTIRDGVTIADELLEIDTFDGQTKMILNYTAPVVDDRGQIEGAVVVNLDVTEREKAAVETRRLAAAVEQAAEIVVITDTDGSIQYANPAFTQVTGYTLGEVLGKNPRILQSGRHDNAFYLDLWETLAAGQVWHGRFINRRKNGDLYTEDAAISPVRDDSGTIVSYVGVKRDITSELNLEQQLRQAQKLESIGTLASGVAHEINNPLMGILNYAELAKDRAPDAKSVEYLDGVIREGNRVAEIVRSLLSFARQEKTGYSPARISDIVEESLSLLRASLRRHQIQIDVDVPEDLPRILCRSQQIQQVIVNLITNAQSALSERFSGFDDDKILVVRAARHLDQTGEWVRLTVEDHGIGIPEGLQERIFDPFFTRKPRDQGTGLGLSVSHGIIKDHRGRIFVESHEGAFTRFHVDLPLAPNRPSDSD